MSVYPQLHPICPRCNTHVDTSTGHTDDGVHLWHWKCRHAFVRDREWLSEAEAEAHFA